MNNIKLEECNLLHKHFLKLITQKKLLTGPLKM